MVLKLAMNRFPRAAVDSCGRQRRLFPDSGVGSGLSSVRKPPFYVGSDSFSSQRLQQRWLWKGGALWCCRNHTGRRREDHREILLPIAPERSGSRCAEQMLSGVPARSKGSLSLACRTLYNQFSSSSAANGPTDLADGLVLYTSSHEYVVFEGAQSLSEALSDSLPVSPTIRLGITSFAQKQLGEVVYVDLPEVGKQVKKGDSIISVESVKAVGEVYAPLDGIVVEANKSIAEDSTPVNEDPQGSGWFIKLKLTTLEDNVMRSDSASSASEAAKDFLTAEQYDARCKEEEAE